MKFVLLVALLYAAGVLLDVSATTVVVAAADPDVAGLLLANGPAALLVLILAAVAGSGQQRLWRYCAANALGVHLRQLCSWSRYRGLYRLRWRTLPEALRDEVVTAVAVLAVAIPLTQATIGMARFVRQQVGPGWPVWSAPDWHSGLVLGLLGLYYPLVYLGLRQRARQQPLHLGLITFAAMLAFAGNSLLCRLALADGSIDAASFTLIRLLAGAVTLAALSGLLQKPSALAGNWLSAGALFVYAAGFSFAYISLSAATGALLLFGAVQATMIGYGVCAGERLSRVQVTGAGTAMLGLLLLLLPGLEAPPLGAAGLMLVAGVAWGVYSLRGQGQGDATQETAGNFVRAVPFAAVLSGLWLGEFNMGLTGALAAVASGALASGLGYALWYQALPRLQATAAATVQLSVPVLAALGGALFLAEPLTLRLLLTSVVILGGVALFMRGKQSPV